MPEDNEVFQLEQRLNARLARLEQDIYGDGKNEIGLKARVERMALILIGQSWHGYALIAVIILDLVILALMGLLFVRVY